MAAELHALLITAELRLLEAQANHDSVSAESMIRVHRAEQDLLLVRVAADSGARHGELTALRFTDLTGPSGRTLPIERDLRRAAHHAEVQGQPLGGQPVPSDHGCVGVRGLGRHTSTSRRLAPRKAGSTVPDASYRSDMAVHPTRRGAPLRAGLAHGLRRPGLRGGDAPLPHRRSRRPPRALDRERPSDIRALHSWVPVVPHGGEVFREPAAVTSETTRPEPEVEQAFERLVQEGEQRLTRPALALVATGLLGGIDVGTGVLAYLLVLDATGQVLLAGAAFSVGFVALLLARSELFTENLLVPVTAVVAKKGTYGALGRLWTVTLVANLAGGLLMMWVVMTARPDLGSVAREAGEHYAGLGVSLRSFLLAVLAGVVITLMTRMQHATESLGVQLVPAILFGALLSGGQLFHCVLDSLFVFAAMVAGADISVGSWLQMLVWSALGNVVGGVGLVTAIRLLRVPRKVSEARADN